MNMKQPGTVGVLMLGGAKRVSMARHLAEAARSLGLRLRLYSYELSAMVPIWSVATIIEGKRWADPEVVNHLHEVVTLHGIDVMIPFVDGAVEVVARYPFSDCYAPVSQPAIAAMMFDKVVAAELFARERIPIPRTYTRGAPQFPLIAKPRMGSASRGLKIVRSSTDFRAIDLSQYLVQEYIEQRREYTVDCFVAQDGRIIAVVPRERLETAGGEVTRTMTVDRDDIAALSRSVLTRLGLTGAVTLQFLQDVRDNRLLLMEINPRLGGGAVCAVAAGADLPLFILKEALGRQLEPCDDWQPGTVIARYMEEVVFKI
ncbi:MAG: ATP-grasp domain-containing protein [Muribaculaceae bacterium]|nr:ATP-grasp domain-containing protein [Muribaculaceae bacterium]